MSLLGEMTMKVQKTNILRVLMLEGVKMYELEVFFQNGKVKRGLKVPFANIAGKREILRFPSVCKVRDWLNSEEGLMYLEKTFSED